MSEIQVVTVNNGEYEYSEQGGDVLAIDSVVAREGRVIVYTRGRTN